tara:strand:+ start:180 stop:419 length:240 start_codon:yes stop_codon:yes gene_type:complete
MTFEESVHNVSLTGNEISTILYVMEGWIQGNDEYNEGSNLSLDVDNIFEALEQVTDNYHTQLEEINELKSALNDGGKVV